MKNRAEKMRGSVLIMVLWALTLLAVFAVQIGAMTQDKIAFLARAERHNLVRDAAQSAVLKALAIIREERFKNKNDNLLERSLTLYHNAGLGDLSFGPAGAAVFYQADGKQIYGVTDEGRRLNINFADRPAIQKLLLLLGASEDEADHLASAIFDWREYGESEIKGFSSDNFYESLQFPYPQKKGKYETLDEVRLVAGMSQKIYGSLIDYVTIYGDQGINMNTVSWQVLTALGFTEEQAKMVEAIRRGADGKEGTADDFFFRDRNMLIGKIVQAFAMKSEEREAFQTVAEKISFVDRAFLFRVESRAQLVSRKENTSITCVFDANDDKIIYWREH